MDMTSFLIGQIRFSRETFGPGRREETTLAHLKKEEQELRDRGGRPEDWVDMALLALDGLTRSLQYDNKGSFLLSDPDAAYRAGALLLHKHTINKEERQWPDWQTHPAGVPMEHIRKEG